MGEVRGRFKMAFSTMRARIGTDTFHAQRERFSKVRDGFAMGHRVQDLELTI